MTQTPEKDPEIINAYVADLLAEVHFAENRALPKTTSKEQLREELFHLIDRR